jgi:hypothetical protein
MNLNRFPYNHETFSDKHLFLRRLTVPEKNQKFYDLYEEQIATVRPEKDMTYLVGDLPPTKHNVEESVCSELLEKITVSKYRTEPWPCRIKYPEQILAFFGKPLWLTTLNRVERITSPILLDVGSYPTPYPYSRYGLKDTKLVTSPQEVLNSEVGGNDAIWLYDADNIDEDGGGYPLSSMHFPPLPDPGFMVNLFWEESIALFYFDAVLQHAVFTSMLCKSG